MSAVNQGRSNAKRLSALCVAMTVVVAMSVSTSAIGAEYKKAATQNYLVQPAPSVTLETATAIVRHRTGGRVLSANPASKGTDVGYQVRVLVDERTVQTWFVDDKGRVDSE